VHPLLFHFGHLAIPTYGVCTALGLLTALAVAMQRSRHDGLPAAKVWNLSLLAILATLVGARLLLIATHLSAFRAHPFWVLGVASPPDGWIELGAAVIGAAAGTLYALAEGLPLFGTMDAEAPAAAVAFAMNRLGAFLAGSAWGTPTKLPWAVMYHSIVAYLWYHVPLGVRLHPVQLYDAAASVGILALLLWMPRQQPGEVAGAWLFLYGLCRFFLEFLRGDTAQAALFGGAVTLAQALSVVAVLAGGALWLRRGPERHSVAI
jgi:phosphatidylglycerol---prolipoprotein diacylglyceryl transferase